MKKMISMVAIVSSVALTIGATNIMSACRLPLIPFIFVSLSSGTICGSMAPTAGV
ncbi:hypothetical protein D3C80_2223640 [compost metagenome]